MVVFQVKFQNGKILDQTKKSVKGLALDFEPESPSQKTKVMSGQTSQNVNKLVGKGVKV